MKKRTLDTFSIEKLTAPEMKEERPDSPNEFKHTLEMVLKWTGSIPPFQNLTSSDQQLLLKQTWHELYLLTLAQSDTRVNLG